MAGEGRQSARREMEAFMKKYVQIYTGGIHGRNITCKDMEMRLRLMEKNRPDGIIVGWSLNAPVYRFLREYTLHRKMELFLWFQVLSEYGSLKDFRPVVDMDGKQPHSMLFDGDEEFSFYCPSHENTAKYLMEIYGEYFATIGFDGVFLDRIRFPSPSIDKSAIFTCSCNACMEKLTGYGITEQDMREVQEAIGRNKEKDGFLGITAYQDGSYTFADKKIEKYFNVRTKLITETVRQLTGYFKSLGLKTGLDLFAPCIALFVGQDYRELSRYADFVKPMLYRYTDTPAGMAYELRGMAAALSAEDKKTKRLESWMEIIGWRDGEVSQFMINELKNAEKLSKCEVYAGMEIHTVSHGIPAFSGIRPQQVREGVSLLEKAGAKGRIASWNIMAAEPENIIAFTGGGRDEV